MRLKELEKKRTTPTQFFERQDGAEARREEMLEMRAKKARKHSKLVKQRRKAKATSPRFDSTSFADFLPDRLKQRLERYRVSTPATILRREARVAKRKTLALLTR